MLLGAIVLAGEAEQLKQKRALPGVRRVVAEGRSERTLRFPDLPGAEKFLSVSWRLSMRRLVGSEVGLSSSRS